MHYNDRTQILNSYIGPGNYSCRTIFLFLNWEDKNLS